MIVLHLLSTFITQVCAPVSEMKVRGTSARSRTRKVID